MLLKKVIRLNLVLIHAVVVMMMIVTTTTITTIIIIIIKTLSVTPDDKICAPLGYYTA
jgi:hypothetical protein